MGRAYSNDLRERVLTRVLLGETVRSVAALYSISPSAVVKWSQRYRRTGSVAPGRIGGYKRKLLADHRDFVRACFAAQPDLTLRDLQARLLAERGVKVSYGAVWDFVHSEGLSYKKTAFASQQNRPAVARRRVQWRKYQGRIEASRLVFIDETWVKTNMAPLRGWGQRGTRLIGKAPHGRWRTQTFLAALRCDRIDAPCVLDGPINGEAFLAYVRQFLLPTLKPRDVVIMDNLGSHKSRKVRQAIRGVGARLLFLPPYSPDLNPIEQVFAKLKHLMRKAQERSPEATWKRAGSLLDEFSPNECANYLVNSGYAST